MFKPKYLKQAKLLDKGVCKFINYKRDILKPEKLKEVVTLHTDFREAIRGGDKTTIEAAGKAVSDACEMAAPSPPQSSLRENVEVLFVAIVVALGVRTYVVQPFRIPTGSMQPTLNGKIGHGIAADEDWGKPNIVQRLFEGAARGRSYVDARAKKTGRLRRDNPVTEKNIWFFSFTTLHFADGDKQTIRAPRRQLVESLGLRDSIGAVFGMHPRTGKLTSLAHLPDLKEGQVLARGWIDTGDQVLVDKISYHFRNPRRGEVFVFRTKNIVGIESRSDFNKDWGSQHYIKRLVGVPGDHLEVKAPMLFINGEEAEEKYIRRVWEGGGDYPGYTMQGRIHDVTLKTEEGRQEYWAQGDNSPQSSDSRDWGTVPEENLVGPGFLVYWPFTNHWGAIR